MLHATGPHPADASPATDQVPVSHIFVCVDQLTREEDTTRGQIGQQIRVVFFPSVTTPPPLFGFSWRDGQPLLFLFLLLPFLGSLSIKPLPALHGLLLPAPRDLSNHVSLSISFGFVRLTPRRLLRLKRRTGYALLHPPFFFFLLTSLLRLFSFQVAPALFPLFLSLSLAGCRVSLNLFSFLLPSVSRVR